jgi:integrase
MAHAQKQVKIANGRITLFLREDVKEAIRQCRITAKGIRGYIHRSTGERELEAAKERALQLLGEIGQRQSQNLPLRKKTFAEVAASFLKDCETKWQEGRNSEGRFMIMKGSRQRYLIPYFGKRDITLIQKKDLIAYRAWRQAYWVTGPGAASVKTRKKPKPLPSPATLKQKHTALRGVFAHGIDMGYVDVRSLGFLKHEKNKVEKRSAFTAEEFRTLRNFMNSWVSQDKNTRVRKDRELLRDYVMIMANSGMRKGEARLIKWLDVLPYENEVGECTTIQVNEGKTGQRLVVCQPGTDRYFDRLKERGHNCGLDDLVFCHEDGLPVQDWTGFTPLLTAAGLLKDSKGENRTIYSLRHTYATQRLQNGANIYWLKKNMGTSVAMIERHYGQTNVLVGIEHETAKRDGSHTIKARRERQAAADIEKRDAGIEKLAQLVLQSATALHEENRARAKDINLDEIVPRGAVDLTPADN